MKQTINKYIIILTLGLSLFSIGCSKDFIDLTDPTRIETDGYYNDSTSISTAVIAAYAGLQEVYGKASGSRGIYPIAEIASDNTTAVVEGSGVGDFEFFQTTSSNQVLQTQWTYNYRVIARCNLVLSRIDAVIMNAAVKERYKSEVKFIRALSYFNLVRTFGGVPLVTKEIRTIEEAYQYGRASVEEVYIQIEQDLNEAKADANLPDRYAASADLGRVTKAAVRGMLGKVYLTEKKYNEAVTELGGYITSYDNTIHSLLPNYSDIFLTTNEMNAEIVFAVRYTKGNVPSTGSPFPNHFSRTTAEAGGVGTGYQFNTLRKDLVDTMTAQGAADKRTAVSFVASGTGAWITRKYRDTPAQDLDSDCDWIVLRHADILLLYAEALNEQSGANVATAVPFVNRIRTRAGFTGAALLDPLTVTQNQLRFAIEKERRIELNLEGHRWFDLVRTGRAIEVMNNHFTKYAIRVTTTSPIVQIQAFQLIFPIPINEINTNPILTQNPGYN
jgi:hypothetical protein